jgi:hypothetical protein
MKWYPIGKSGVDKTYVASSKEQCELEHGQACYDIGDNHPDDCDLADQQFPILDADGVQLREQVPVLDGEGNPVLDENGQPTFTDGELLFETRTVAVPNAERVAARLAAQTQVAKVQDRSKARAFCLSIVNEIAAINKDLNDPQLMATIFSTATFQAIILALLTGGTATARALMVQHGPSLYPQATVDSLVAKMDAYIASET